ncbi:MAG TPA: hypothetical protein VG709_02970, partial [Actinomycetota bacterium]|nr:hypothetical protein [Actinomycetota bacterium]
MEPRTRRALVAALASLSGIAAFLLIRPFAGPLAPYGPRPPGTTYAYGFVVLGAFVPYAVAARASRRGVSLRLAVGGTALLAALLLPAAATQSQDVYAYLFYGKIWSLHGANPYV